MRPTVTILVVSLLCPSLTFAADEEGAPIAGSIARAVAREVARSAQDGANGNGGDRYRTSGLLMIGAGTALALMGSMMPQFRTQTDDYDLCAAANGGPTGPSTRNSACDDYRVANKGFLWVGAAAIAGGASLLSVGAFKNLTLRVSPRGAVVGKTARF